MVNNRDIERAIEIYGALLQECRQEVATANKKLGLYQSMLDDLFQWELYIRKSVSDHHSLHDCPSNQ